MVLGYFNFQIKVLGWFKAKFLHFSLPSNSEHLNTKGAAPRIVMYKTVKIFIIENFNYISYIMSYRVSSHMKIKYARSIERDTQGV